MLPQAVQQRLAAAYIIYGTEIDIYAVQFAHNGFSAKMAEIFLSLAG